jgi:gamma-glutamyltranspeptidase/glutathione hydrolase
LGGSGVCLVYDHAKQSVETLDFLAPQRGAPVPATARGLYALYAKYGGGMRWEQLVIPAERMARLGQPVSRALGMRMAAWPSGEIDAATKAVFFHADGRPLAEGDNLLQPGLGATLSRIRAKGPGALYEGKGALDLARSLANATTNPPSAAEIRSTLPQWRPAGKVEQSGEAVYFPGAEMNSLGEGQVWSLVIAKGPAGAGPDARLKPITDFFAGRAATAQAASSGVVAVGRDGSAVACDFTMGRPFGTGHVDPDTGLMPAALPTPHLQPLLATNAAASEFRFALTAPPAAGLAAIACGGAAPHADSCRAVSDPKGAGLAGLAGEE